MNTKNLVYCFGLNVTLVLLIIIGLNLSVSAQKEKKSKPKKFGWSLKKDKNKAEKNSKNDKPNAKPDEDDVININTDLIVNDISVLDQKGEAVVGLKQTDFIVIEDDVTQEIEVFSSPSIEKPTSPRHFLFVIEYDYTSLNHSRNSIDAAKLFVDKLAPQDKMAIVSDDVKLLQDFTNDKTRLKNKFESVYKHFDRHIGRSGGWGLTYTALHTALTEMFDEKGIRPIIILQTKGLEFDFIKGGKHDASRSPFGLHYGFYNFTFEDLLRKIIEKRVTVYTIIVGRRFVGISDKEMIKNMVLFQIDHQYDWTPVELKSIEPPAIVPSEEVFIRRVLQDHLRWQPAMIKIAETSGGTTNFLQTPEDVKTTYSDIFDDVQKRYLIGYYSTNQSRDVKLRNVKIEVRDHPEYKILGRKTYIPR